MLPSESRALAATLEFNNLSLRDLDFTGRGLSEKKNLPFIDDCLKRPLKAISELQALHLGAASAMPSGIIKTARTVLLGDPLDMRSPIDAHWQAMVPSSLPADLRPAITSCCRAVDEANQYVYLALKGLTAKEKRLLVDSLPAAALGDPVAKFSFQKTGAVPKKVALEVLSKVNLPLIRRAAQAMAEEIERNLPALRAANTSWTGTERFTFGSIKVIVSGVGDDVHRERNANLVIDLGGRNRYEGREGAGILGAAAVIDCGKEAIFEQGDLGAGVGLMGIGICYAMGSKASFSGRNMVFGVGIGGVGALFHDGPVGSYRAQALSQGFATFGVGAVIDAGSSTAFESEAYSQGAARTQGVGWLVRRPPSEEAGSDSFVFADGHRKGGGQGFGDGIEGGEGGGIGLLTDFAAVTLEGSCLCQGAGRDGGLGSAYLQADSELAAASGQGYGFQHGVGALFVGAPSSCRAAITYRGQGTGEDGGVGVLHSRAGSLSCVGPTRPGLGLSRGLGILLEANREPASGFLPAGAVGDDALGLFVSTNPTSYYRRAYAGASLRSEPIPAEAVAGMAIWRPKAAIGSKAVPSNKEMEWIYDRAVLHVGSAMEDLAAFGEPGFEWIMARKLKGAGPGDREVISKLVEAEGEAARNALAMQVLNADEGAALAALEICDESGVREVAATIEGALRRTALRDEASKAAGLFGVKLAVPELMVLAGGADLALAQDAMNALVCIADPQSTSTAVALLAGQDFAMREAAVKLVAKLPGGFNLASKLASSPNELEARTAIQVLSLIGSGQALSAIGGRLDSVRSSVRLESLIALYGRVPSGYATKVRNLRQDPNPLVAALATKESGA